MRVGVLTGGGDCPGLNAVIRAVVRKGVREYGFEFVGFRDGWRGPLENLTTAARHRRRCAASCPRGGTILEVLADQPVQDRRTASSRSRTTSPANGVDALIAIGGEDTLGVATKLADLGVNVVGVPEDDRQRPVRHRLHLRLRHRGQHRDGGDRPAAHDGRVAPPRAGRRGDGPARRLDRAARGHRRRRQRRADPRAALRHREGLRATSRSGSRSHYAPIVVVSEGATPVEGGDMTLVSGEKDAFGHVRLGGIGDRLAKEIEDRTGKEARAVVLGHVQRGGTPDGVRPLAGDPVRPAGRSTPSPSRTSARWWRCAAPTSSGSRWPRAPASSSWSSPSSTPRPRSSSGSRCGRAGRRACRTPHLRWGHAC